MNNINDGVPKVESSWCRERKEWNLLVRSPFYMNLRLGATQNALWVGRDLGRTGWTKTVFNWFTTPWSPYSVTLGHTSRATLLAEIRRMNVEAGLVKEQQHNN
jgi:hypothetical protein